MRHIALIVAAGRGTRAGAGLPKQYRQICGIAMLERTLMAVLSCDQIDGVFTIIHPDDKEAYEAVASRVEDGRMLDPIHGGATRAISVRNGLHAAAQFAPEFVHIHDAARPFVTPAVLDRCVAGVEQHDGVFPAVPVADALWKKSDLTPVDRDGLIRAQTPQSFVFDKILAAHEASNPNAQDDVAIARAAGLQVVPIDGEEANFKVTTQDDFKRAEHAVTALPDIRVGTGFDVHAFSDGETVILCGISVPHTRALKGHSDADVAMHAITDAIYGALAEGDIGQWFPPSDPQWKGAASDTFLKHAMERARERGFVVSHIDCTIICEAPKIGPHATQMREELSRITGLEVARISVKATTSERLGFTGRGEGIAAQASATLVGA